MSLNRFYSHVSVIGEGGGYSLYLDGKPARTPKGHRLTMPCLCLSEAVADEWRCQEVCVDLFKMPVTRLIYVVIDHVCQLRSEVIAEILHYFGSDMLCYRVSDPQELGARQRAEWDPILEWARVSLDVTMPCIDGVMFAPVPERSLEIIQSFLDHLDDFTLGALLDIVSLTGSGLLALAFLYDRLDSDVVWRLAHLDEDWQRERWGTDREAGQYREDRRREFDAAVFVVNCARRMESRAGES